MKFSKFTSFTLVVFIAVLLSINLSAQPDRYILNGSASRNNCNCYTLTTATNTQAGSVWNKVKINLTEAFDFTFNVFLGCVDANGADGIVFIMQPIGTSIGTTGEGMGFSGIQPSVGIALDTWQNANRNDPAFDHISIQLNGIVDHGNDLAGPVPVSATSDNIEDCQWHMFRIVWDPVSKSLRSYFDGMMRVEVNIDLVKDVFRNDPMVYWGFSAATGGANNLQQFCTALNPKFESNPDTSCISPNGNTITFIERSESFAPITKYYWDFGDGSISDLAIPPPHTYHHPGVYGVKLAITGKDGCNSDTISKNIIVGSYPKAEFNVYDTCLKTSNRIVDLSTNETGIISQHKWVIDGTEEQSSLEPNLGHLPFGPHQLALQVISAYGCASTFTTHTFNIKERPIIDVIVSDGCVKQPILFKGNQNTSSQVPINNWIWNFGDGLSTQMQNPQHIFMTKGNYEVAVWGLGNNGCSSDTIKHHIIIDEAIANAGTDTVVLENVPFRLNGGGNGNFSWSPANNLDNANIARPVTKLFNNQTFNLTVTTPRGCSASDEVTVIVFKGSSIFVPNAFTPNNDRLNDILKPKYIGIKNLNYFSVYNRWGELIFKTSDLSKGWDGTIRGKEEASGTFVWILNAVDYIGKVYQMKGSATLIR